MSIGNFISSAAGSLFGKDKPWLAAGAQLAGAGYDAYRSNKNASQQNKAYEGALTQSNQDYRYAMQQQQQLNDWQMGQHGQNQEEMRRQYGMARGDADFATQLGLSQANAQTGERLAMRDRLLGHSANMGAAMQQAQAQLGMAYRPTQGSVQSDYHNIRDLNMGNLDRLVQNATSRTQAGAVARGMDSSTQHRDQQADWVRQFAPKYQEADQQAFDQAVGRADSQQNLFQTGRNNRLGEVKDVMGAQYNMEQPLYNSQYSSPVQATLADGPGVVNTPNISADGYFNSNSNTALMGDRAQSASGAAGVSGEKLGEAIQGFGNSARNWWDERKGGQTVGHMGMNNLPMQYGP